MKIKLFLITAIIGILTAGTSLAANPEREKPSEDQLRKTAMEFVKVVDNNDVEALKKILHPQLIQYVQLGENLVPFKAADFIQMVADKKIGGTPREVTFKSSKIVRGKTGNVVLNAVSHEYDFMYQLSMVEADGQWLIVGILIDIQKV
ncbi:MAG: nuclear transport factor 2 family protein [Bacteroidota bacterium]